MSLDILAFFAHPDDETMLCGGTLALLTHLGARVHIWIATRGEGGEMGEPETCTREELGQVREAELRCAAQALGAASLTLMDYRDPLIGPENSLFAFTDNLEQLVEKVIKAIQYHQAGAVLAHGVNGEYGHPAHILVHQAVRMAVDSLKDEAPLFYSVQGAFAEHPFPRLANADAPAHMILDVTPCLPEKTSAALCHRTQHALFVRFHSQELGRTLTVPEIIMPVESLHRVAPSADGNGTIHDPLADLLWGSGLARPPKGG